MEEQEQIATEYCSNCKKDIPLVNYVMHTSHCSRNITLCDLCKEPVPISEKEEHFEEYHAKVKCDCGKYFEKMHLDDHKEKDCCNRKVVCEYCELELPFQEMKSHKDFCGSRTELCDKCNKYVQHKDLENHLNSDCQAERPSVQNNAASSFVQSGRPNRIPPDELIQNVDFGDSFDSFEVDALQRFLLATQGTSPEGHYGVRDMFEHRPRYDTQDMNMFPQPSRDVVARGFSSQPNRSRRDRRSGDIDDVMYNEDIQARNQLESDELMAALLACDNHTRDSDPPSLSNERTAFHRRNSFEDDAENGGANHESALDQTYLPCEFCGEAIQAQELILHQTGCQLTTMGAASPSGGYPNLRSQPRSLPPIQYESFNDEVERDSGIDDHNQTLLPCEFCDELIQPDFLFSHQSMCDPQRTRPSSVLQTEHFYENEPEPPLSNNARPRASHRPPRPSRPVVDNRTFDNLLNNEPKTSSASMSAKNDNRFSIPRNNLSEPPKQSPTQNNRDNRETHDMRVRLNGSPLTTADRYSTKKISLKQGQNHRHSLPEMPSEENNDKHEIALPRKGSAGEKLVGFKDTARSKRFSGVQEAKLERASNSKTPFESSRFRNGRKVDSEPDLGITALPPQKVFQEPGQPSKYRSTRLEASGARLLHDKNKSSKTPSTKKKPSAAKESESFQNTKESRKQLTRLAPCFDGRRQDERTQPKSKGTSERRGEIRSTEERGNSSAESRPRRSKKKFA